jgi:deoxyribonuclease-4
MPAQLLGAHMPVGKGLPFAVKNGKAIGCTAVQVFTSSPRQWYGREVAPSEGEALQKAMVETGMGGIVSHDTYLINLCAPTPEVKEKSLKAIKEELVRCSTLGIPYVVSHMGAHSGQGDEAGLWGVAEAAKEVLAETPDDVTLLMETTAGQGSSLNHRFEHLAILLNLTGAPERLCVCLDTCHIFAAGYDIRTAEGYEATFAEFDRLVGIERIKCIHCNDSQKKLGSRVDRHAHIGEGEIGIEAFRCLVNDPRFERVPILLETPDADTMHEVNLKRLMDLREPA